MSENSTSNTENASYRPEERKPKRNNKQSRSGRVRGRGNDQGKTTPCHQNVDITIKSSDIGKLIGKNGGNIKQIEKESLARIVVDSNNTKNEFTNVYINGSYESKEKAVRLIKDLLHMAPGTSEVENPDNTSKTPEDGVAVEHDSASGEQEGGYLYMGKVYKSWMDIEPEVIDFEELNKKNALEEKEKWAKCPKILKNVYIEDPEISTMTPESVDLTRKMRNNIKVQHGFESSTTIPKPIIAFIHAFKNYPYILECLEKKGFICPLPIQSQGWPVIMSGNDMIGITQTGTGKTLAYLLPAFVHIEGQLPTEEKIGPAVLIIAPTRELALQISEETKEFSCSRFTSACIYGGGDRTCQVDQILQFPNIIIGTPGRLLDMIDSGYLNSTSVTYVVIDEADRMLNLGFEKQIQRILENIRPDRQLIFTSATWPLRVRNLAESLMNNPIQVVVGELDLAATHSVTQDIVMVNEKQKFDYLFRFIKKMTPDDKSIIFVSKKATAKDLCERLKALEIKCDNIRGDREQYEREKALYDFRMGVIKILIATDVASRGLDICDITLVVNYDFPSNIEEYVHRIGRAGRAGKTGASASYLSTKDKANAAPLIKILEEANQVVPEGLRMLAKTYVQAGSSGSRGNGGNRNRYSNIAI